MNGDADRWHGEPLAGDRLVVVAPHPDDEVLEAGGLIHWWATSGRPVVIVAVTDGESSHARSTRIGADELRWRRAGERDAALAHLGVRGCPVDRLAQPDQGCADHGDEIAAALRNLLRSTDAVVGPAVEDRHPDHVAVARALRDAAAGIVAHVWEAPTWALVHGTAPFPSTVLSLGRAAWCAKRRAAHEFRSQLVALGPDTADGPVVHPHELDEMLRRQEQFRRVET